MREGWTRVTFGHVVRQVQDRVDPATSGLERYVAGEHMDTDDLRIRRWGRIGEGYLGPAFHMRFRPGQVLYGSRRTYLRKVALADFVGITANTTLVLEPYRPDLLVPELLPFLMQSDGFHRFSIQQSRGSVNPYINYSDLALMPLTLPPVDQQRSIATLLVAARAAFEAIAEAVDAATEVELAASTRLLDPLSANRSDRTDGWPLCPLEDLTQDAAPIGYGIVQVGRFVPEGVPTLTIKDLRPDYRGTIHRTDPAIEAGYARSRVVPGDVLVSVKATVGEIAIVPDGFTGNISRDLARIRLNNSKVRPRFFWYLYRSPRFASVVRSLVVGSTRDELSIAALRRLMVPIPDVGTQVQIVEHLDEATELRRLVSDRAASAKLLYLELIRRELHEVAGGG